MTGDNKEQLDRFSEYMRQRLDDHQMKVDDSCWNNIESRLKPAKRKNLRWIVFSAAAAVVLLLLLVVPYISDTSKIEEMAQVTGKAEVHEIEDISETLNVTPPESKPQENDAATATPLLHKSKEKQPDAVSKNSSSIVSAPIPDIERGNDVGVVDKSDVTDNDIDSGIEENGVEKKYEYVDLPDNSSKIPVFRMEKAKQNNWELGLSVGSTRNENDIDSEIYAYASKYSPSLANGKVEDSYLGWQESSIAENLSDATHNAPLSFGITVRKNISNRIALESGLVYTYLSSKFKGVGGSRSSAKSELHYLGVPLNAVFYLYNQKKWNVYLAGGGMVEKGLRLKYSQNMVFSNNKGESTSVKSSVDGLQWSVNVSAGVAYRVYGGWNIYVEPKLSYFFDNNQPISIRTDNPFSVGLGAGIKYDF
ncbi:outer membrane beta-barrel protein [Dysgonomonas sp. 520]|uniref:outer membrane beta-barrel protein n=1 Tax=Dysgonomonas sp. 520 TaxID=2302931 RepID=UPI0013D04F34|nr:outer membrane beta-barrel protein [Dysgonomonas sp. 520]NDW10852.1 porin family protein [Dysgonomonas sp. 520]